MLQVVGASARQQVDVRGLRRAAGAGSSLELCEPSGSGNSDGVIASAVGNCSVQKRRGGSFSAGSVAFCRLQNATSNQ